jgi:hypothetical protein
LVEKEKMDYAEVSAKTGQNIAEVLTFFGVEIAKKKADVVESKDIYMTFLLALNEDFDDDFLREAIELLVDL